MKILNRKNSIFPIFLPPFKILTTTKINFSLMKKNKVYIYKLENNCLLGSIPFHTSTATPKLQ